jgi:hypothetical protein
MIAEAMLSPCRDTVLIEVLRRGGPRLEGQAREIIAFAKPSMRQRVAARIGSDTLAAAMAGGGTTSTCTRSMSDVTGKTCAEPLFHAGVRILPGGCVCSFPARHV